MLKITIRGKVFSGRGKGSFFVSRPWVMKQIEKKLGFKPYPGTLNIQVSESETVRRRLDITPGIRIVPDEGFCSGKCFKAIVANRIDGAIIIPEVPCYPKNTLEIIAPVNLRKELGIRDGDEIEITIMLE